MLSTFTLMWCQKPYKKQSDSVGLLSMQVLYIYRLYCCVVECIQVTSNGVHAWRGVYWGKCDCTTFPVSHTPYIPYTHTQGYCGGILHDGQYMVNYTDIILVTINYRLGALGFLVYGSNLEIGGNYGLKVLYTHTHVYIYMLYTKGLSINIFVGA